MTAWTDQFVGDRMAVDREFTERVAASEFSSQEWGTVMTAVEFRIEDPESPDDARIVADTSKVDQVLPAIESMRDEMGLGGAPRDGGDRSGSGVGSSSGGGIFGTIKRSLGVSGDDGTDHRAESAAALADEYAQRFQEHLEQHGKWEQACAVAASAGDASRGEHAGESSNADDATDATDE